MKNKIIFGFSLLGIFLIFSASAEVSAAEGRANVQKVREHIYRITCDPAPEVVCYIKMGSGQNAHFVIKKPEGDILLWSERPVYPDPSMPPGQQLPSSIELTDIPQ